VLIAATLLFFAGYPRQIDLPGILSFNRVETAAGGTQKVTLADGSAIDVSGKSALRATLTRHARDITLERGEAFFRVAKDPARPFTVRAGATVITAVGTAFNVRRSGERVVVAVAEGVVRIAGPSQTAQLQAGEQLSTERPGAALEKAPIDAASVAGWRDGRLRYLNEPLGSVVADVGRYTARDIEIADPALGELRITGTVLEHNLDGWLQSLEEAFPVVIAKNADGSITIAANRPPR
jgi:transmembrane sensor